MIQPNRIYPSNLIGGLAIVCLLVSISGCTQLNGRLRLPGANDPAANVPIEDGYQAPSASATAAPESSAVRFDRAAAQSAGQVQQTGVQQVAHNDRHVAHQFPTAPGGQQIPFGTQPVANAAATGQPVNQDQAVAPAQAVAPLFGPQRVAPPQMRQRSRTNFANPQISPGAGAAFPPIATDPIYTPTTREADLIINGFPGRTGRITFGAAVNSDAGVTGQITIDERNFDIFRFPRSFQDLFRGNAFRGKGQTLRIEAVPGSDFDRYIIQFANPNLFTYMPISMSVSGFLYDRRFEDWDEERLGGRVSLGYRLTPDLSLSVGVSGQNVNISNPRDLSTPELTDVLGDNEYYSGLISLKHDTRNSPIQPSDGHYFEFSFEEAFGDFDYARFELEYRTYWLIAQRADFSGKQTISYSTQVGFSGDDTPIFENFYAGGYATLRGFDFRGASPLSPTGIEVGGQFQWLNSVEYMFPITADDAFRGVAFVDFGTVEPEVDLKEDSFRVSPGLGLRVAIPMLGPAPLAFDFAYPVAKADTDQRRLFSFYMSVVR